VNWGARPFAYTAPSGFKALCTTNLPTPLIEDGSTVMDVLTWSGNNASPRSFTGLNFSPDFVWIKSRSDAAGHGLYDSVRLAGNVLRSMDTSAEVANSAFGYISGFNSDGFALTAGTYPGYESGDTNMTGRTYVAWTWDAGGTTDPSNEAGSITSQVRANASAGFSVVTYTGNGGTNATVGHGLGVAPQLVIGKWRGGSSDWEVYHKSAGATKVLQLNATNAAGTLGHFGSTDPTSTSITVNANGTGNEINGNGQSYVLYAFAPVAGYSSFGSYTGNGSATDGPFVFCNFRPRWILIKRSSATENWMLYDAARSSYNASNDILRADISDAELADYTAGDIDLLSNGFKLRGTWTGINASGSTYIYAAFAEHPFATSRAR
jgi:hypothetical protein